MKYNFQVTTSCMDRKAARQVLVDQDKRLYTTLRDEQQNGHRACKRIEFVLKREIAQI